MDCVAKITITLCFLKVLNHFKSSAAKNSSLNINQASSRIMALGSPEKQSEMSLKMCFKSGKEKLFGASNKSEHSKTVRSDSKPKFAVLSSKLCSPEIMVYGSIACFRFLEKSNK